MSKIIKIVISSIVTLFILSAIAIGGLLYFGLFENLTNGIVGMYYVNKGDKAYRKKNLAKAIEYYQKGLKAYPKHFEAWTNLGNIYVTYEDFYSAKDAYEHAIEVKPNYTIARMNYGIIATEKLGDFEEAIKQFNSILTAKNKIWFIPFIFNNKKSTKMNKGLAYYNLGVAYRMKSFYESENQPQAEEDLRNAIKYYEEALKIMPKDYSTLFNLGVVYQLSGNTKKSAQNYCKAIAIEPMNYEAHYNLAILLRHLKMYKEAYNEIEKATILASEGNINSNAQSYVFDILNDMSMALIVNDDYKSLLETQNNSEITYVHGKMVATEDLDKAILKNLKKCEAKEYIEEDSD
ncbi:tetratricopeptide repeat protein [bacterium]|nr:tetratricopeptide repeat protein [bacterium]